MNDILDDKEFSLSKFRPNIKKGNLFCIPDLHGGYDLLMNICDRILPLRKSEGILDKLIFLGDYIDRHIDSHKVIDFLIELKKKYGEQIIFLMGNHELMLLKACNLMSGKEYTLQDRKATHNMWMVNGGFDTVQGYLNRAKREESALNYPTYRVADLLPKEHVEFFQNLQKGYEFENFVFVHGGVNPLESVSKQELEILAWDRNLVKYVLNAIQNDIPLEWEKTIVCGHSVMSNKEPVVQDNYLMLDCGSPKQLLVVELRSREAYMSYPDQKRMVKYELKNTVKRKLPFSRVT